MPAGSENMPEQFGRYEVYESLGVGGMATVHRARERGIAGFERIVALKRLLPNLAQDELFVRAFVREARCAAMLSHVNIVQIFELGRIGHSYFISMEHIEGVDVREIIRRAERHQKPPPIEVTLSIAVQTCEALAHAHSRTGEDGAPLGLIHRDVSPSNLRLNRDGYVKVIDFGIAKARTAALQTYDRAVKGKLAYLPPEAFLDVELDARADLFALGVTVHELLTGRRLFAASTEYETLHRVESMEIEPPSLLNPSCPPELDAVVLGALARDRDARWPSADEFGEALARVAAGRGLDIEPRAVRDWLHGRSPRKQPLAPLRIPASPPREDSIQGVRFEVPPPVEARRGGSLWRTTVLLMLLSAVTWAALIARALSA